MSGFGAISVLSYAIRKCFIRLQSACVAYLSDDCIEEAFSWNGHAKFSRKEPRLRLTDVKNCRAVFCDIDQNQYPFFNLHPLQKDGTRLRIFRILKFTVNEPRKEGGASVNLQLSGLRQVLYISLAGLTFGGCTPVSKEAAGVVRDELETVVVSKVTSRSKPSVIPAIQLPAPMPSDREERCGLKADGNARYGEVAELDFANPDSFTTLECIDRAPSKFSFHLNFLAAETMRSRKKFCEAAQFLARGLRSTENLGLAPGKVSPRMEAVSVWQYPWYSRRLCVPRVRLNRIIDSAARYCAANSNLGYLQGVQSELEKLPPHDHQWSSC